MSNTPTQTLQLTACFICLVAAPFHAHKVDEVSEFFFPQRLDKAISYHLPGWEVINLDPLFLELFPHKVPLHINVLAPSMILRVLRKCQRSHVVSIQLHGILVLALIPYLTQETLQPNCFLDALCSGHILGLTAGQRNCWLSL